ncbi:MAG: DEAD/DEAH box helicase [Ruminococcus sp.]|nr:DEAD/DEAH box helicase [Ruminococcus sp.]
MRFEEKPMLKPVNKSISDCIVNTFGINHLCADILVSRGYVEPDVVEGFLNSTLDDLYSPFLYKDMNKACDRIIQAVNLGQVITVYGNNDVDGIISTSILATELFYHQARVNYYLPLKSEGFGLNLCAIDKIARSSAKLIITLSYGISDTEQISYAKSLGIDVIVVDHHQYSNTPVNCYALLNVSSKGERLCSAGIVGKLVWALFGKKRMNMYLDLMALAAAASDLPLTEENRIIVKYGLKSINISPRPCFLALADKLQIKGDIESYHLSSLFAPLLTSPTRLDSAVRLLTSSSQKQALYMIDLFYENKDVKEIKPESVCYYDKALSLTDVSPDFISSLNILKPFGKGNTEPLFLIEDVKAKDIAANPESFRTSLLDKNGHMIKAVSFNKTAPPENSIISVLVKFDKNLCVIENMLIKKQAEALTNKEKSVSCSSAIYGHVVKDEDLKVLDLPERKIKQLNTNGIHTVRELTRYMPSKYLDFREPKTVKQLKDKTTDCVIGTVEKLYIGKAVNVICRDTSGDKFIATWFHQDYVAKQMIAGRTFMFCGRISIRRQESAQSSMFTFIQTQIIPSFWSDDLNKYRTLVPVYKKIKGMSNDYLSASINKAIDHTADIDYLEKDILERFNLITEKQAITNIHHPRSEKDIEEAQKRHTFDQLFRFSFALKENNKDNDSALTYKLTKSSILSEIEKKLPFTLTVDQQSTINSIAEKLKSGKRLSALVQGDVSSGKTIIAFMTMFLAYQNGFQSCILAPTEVLAHQHFEDLKKLTDDFGIETACLTGSLKANEKKKIVKDLAEGKIQMIVGTHALLQDNVVFKNLALVVIDEEHRFGVNQRNKLLKAQKKPHIVTMSATPIPRSLCMALYGDSISVFDIHSKPDGRKPVITKQTPFENIAFLLMLDEIHKGRQCYVICPLIDESSALSESVRSVEAQTEYLKAFFSSYPEVKIGSITGRMKKDDIAKELQNFSDGKTNVLVSTTVIEVGVNIPDATIITILNSERFGLAQLHQLRGRVGRSYHQSYCILVTSNDDKKAKILCSTSDGFEIAKQDVLMRGTGDFLGTQQSGVNKDVLLMLQNPEMYNDISKLNDMIISAPSLYAKYKDML